MLSGGPLCGKCIDGYVYSSAQKICILCSSSWIFAAIIFAFAFVTLAVWTAFYTGRLQLPAAMQRSWIVGVILNTGSGEFRVLWSTYQIVQVYFEHPFQCLLWTILMIMV